jgi:hypothetical protein
MIPNDNHLVRSSPISPRRPFGTARQSRPRSCDLTVRHAGVIVAGSSLIMVAMPSYMPPSSSILKRG